MKRLIFALFLMICYLAISANNKSLFITFSDGTKVEFALTTMPEITIADNKMKVTSTITTAEYNLYKVNTFTYNTTTGISNIETDNGFAINGNRIIVSGTNNKIRIFATDGKAVSIIPILTNGQTIINLDILPTGIYIINLNGKSIKIAKR